VYVIVNVRIRLRKLLRHHLVTKVTSLSFLSFSPIFFRAPWTHFAGTATAGPDGLPHEDFSPPDLLLTPDAASYFSEYGPQEDDVKTEKSNHADH
jgi:hypothetical protein